MSTLSGLRFASPAGSSARGPARTFPSALARAFGPNVTDEALVAAIAQGDRHAMALLYGRHSVRVHRFILRMASDATLAENLVSEVFLEVWRHAEGFAARSRVSTWLLAIARNKTLSAVRRHRDESLDEHRAAVIEDPADDPEISAQKQDRSATIQRCLSQLSRARPADHCGRGQPRDGSRDRLCDRRGRADTLGQGGDASARPYRRLLRLRGQAGGQGRRAGAPRRARGAGAAARAGGARGIPEAGDVARQRAGRARRRDRAIL